MIAIINYGLGNLTSIQNMCKRIGINSIITNDIETLNAAEKLILPGVGHFKKGMENLHQSGLKNKLDEMVLIQKKPILGICLGAQLMTKHSEEGDIPGLGWVDATTIKFNESKINDHKIPHMGWSDIHPTDINPLWNDLPPEPRFYFVHSYHFLFQNEEEISAMSNYSYSFACAFKKDNIYGTQFHPEKSHKFGMKVLENFNNVNK